MTSALLACVAILAGPQGGKDPDFPFQSALSFKRPHVLVFSKTAAFRHDSIPVGVKMFESMGLREGVTCEATEDAAEFNPERLGNFNAVVFLSTTGDVLNDAQQLALQEFVEAGGGFVGIHAASDTEYDWGWYGECVGAYFKSHPTIQPARVLVEDRRHPSTQFLPEVWERTDEWYDFRANPRGKVRVLASLDPKSYSGSSMADDHPITWCRQVGKGRAWYTAFGHTAETYGEPNFRRMVYEAIVWASQGRTPKDATPIEFMGTPGWTNEGGVWSNGEGKTANLVSKEFYGDGHYHIEFLVPKGSNSGVYLQGRYELQIVDDEGPLTYSSVGGIYAGYDGQKGYAPLADARLKAGEWNTYDIVFRAPRFDGETKLVNAYFVEVRLNGVVVQKLAGMPGTTGAPIDRKEAHIGPVMLQGDHGPIRFRNAWFTRVVLDYVN